jgi:hypothetical protein
MTTQGLKVCTTCNEEKFVFEFNRKRSTKDGLQFSCRDCQKKQRIALAEARGSILNRVEAMYKRAKFNAHQAGRKFTITKELIESLYVTRCPILGIDLNWGPEAQESNDCSPSLDRIRSDLGYEPGNVWIISWRANRLKSNATPQELQAVASAVNFRIEASNYELIPYRTTVAGNLVD